MRRFAGIPVSVVPNFMNRAQLALSQRVVADKAKRQPGESGLVHLGYFSGSPSHNRDLAIAAPALAELLAEDPRLGVVLVGYIEIPPVLARFGNRVTRFAFTDYVNLQRHVGSVEYNLMPLQANAFTACKSELKYFEAAAVGTLSIASPSPNYAAAIAHGVTGWHALAHEWAPMVREALGRLADYPAMAQAARADALGKYAWTVQRPAILAALGLQEEAVETTVTAPAGHD
jgi:glycosyltransferase involved in cell wall biosynthesis